MDIVKQLNKKELAELNLKSLYHNCDNLFFICLDSKSEYQIVPLADCKMEDIFGFIRDDRPVIKIYGGKEVEDAPPANATIHKGSYNRITIEFANRENLSDFADWLFDMFKEYRRVVLDDIFIKAGFGDREQMINADNVTISGDENKLFIYKEEVG